MPLFDRLKDVVRSEITSLRNRASPSDKDGTDGTDGKDGKAGRAGKATGKSPSVDATMPRRSPAVVDVDGALRVLELTGTPTLDEVRRQYRALAHRYHPKTRSAVSEEVNAARVVLDALTDALELLEEHLLPVATATAPTTPSSSASTTTPA